MFNKLIQSARIYATNGDTKTAIRLLELARQSSFGPGERKACHDLANEIQGVICNQYLELTAR